MASQEAASATARIRHAKKRAFLAAFAKTGIVGAAAEEAGIHRSSVRIWRAQDPDFAAAYEAAYDEAGDHLEREALRRATLGVEEVVYHQGRPVGTQKRYSDTLLIFLLKGARPEKYRERASVSLDARVTHFDGDSQLDRDIADLLGRMDQAEASTAGVMTVPHVPVRHDRPAESRPGRNDARGRIMSLQRP